MYKSHKMIRLFLTRKQNASCVLPFIDVKEVTNKTSLECGDTEQPTQQLYTKKHADSALSVGGQQRSGVRERGVKLLLQGTEWSNG